VIRKTGGNGPWSAGTRRHAPRGIGTGSGTWQEGERGGT
jgi:hypothetical protein